MPTHTERSTWSPFTSPCPVHTRTMNECIAVIWAQQGLFTVCGPRKNRTQKKRKLFLVAGSLFPLMFLFLRFHTLYASAETMMYSEQTKKYRQRCVYKKYFVWRMLSDFEVIQVGFNLHLCIPYPSGFLAYRVLSHRPFVNNCIFVCLVFSFGSLHIVIVLQPYTAYLFCSFPARPLNDACPTDFCSSFWRCLKLQPVVVFSLQTVDFECCGPLKEGTSAIWKVCM